ncbi:MAG: hypothetical protein IKJ82_08735 [Oscillospiraceae bacterium]|nr:hypothetical protein [Oscillospiraceae bacterium]
MEIRDIVNKLKEIFETIYSFLFWLIPLGLIIYFIILPELGIDLKDFSWDSLDPFATIKEEAYQEGFTAGRKEGVKAGEESGYELGYKDGYDSGVSDGSQKKLSELREQGKTYEAGYRKGYEEGKTVGEKNTEYVASTTGTSHVIGNSNNFEHPINSGTAGSSGTSGNNNNGGNTYYEEIAEECDYVLNKNTKKFHKPSCSSAKQIKDKNREYFTGTREEVLARGFDPCGRCNP